MKRSKFDGPVKTPKSHRSVTINQGVTKRQPLASGLFMMPTKFLASTIFSVCALALTGIMTQSSGAAELKRYDEGTQTCRILRYESTVFGKGHKLFVERCKSCHHRGNDQNASFIYTETLPPRGWNRVFYKQNIPCAKSGEWDGLSKEDKLLINDFLWRNGATTYDAYDESKCG